MATLLRVLAFFVGILAAPVLVFAQASITGVVKDTSGAVLPGVTVDVASPVLIERVRSVNTDSNGAYRIIDLRPGAYTVTFTLAGFKSVKREGVALSGSITAVVDSQMPVGGLEETITVSGEAASVDVQSTTKQQVMSSEVIDTIPTGKNFYNLGVLITGVNSSQADVGGSLGDSRASLSAHGGRPDDQRLLQNGSNLNDLQTAGGNMSGSQLNVAGAAEITISFGSASAEQSTGGVYVNFIPKDGGNSFRGSSFLTFANEDMASSNLTQRLKDRGLTAVNSLKKNWDISPNFGGPVKRDVLWYYVTLRHEGAQNYPAGIVPNRNAFKSDVWTYDPDTSAPKLATRGAWQDEQLRLTWQATQKHKFSGTIDNNTSYVRWNGISATTTPEAANDRRFPQQLTLIGEWKAPLSNRVLAEAVVFHKSLRWGTMHLRPEPAGSLNLSPAELAIYPTLVGVTEQSTGLNYHGPGTTSNGVQGAFHNTWVPNYSYRGAISYVTGSHNAKFGGQDSFGYQQSSTYSHDVPYRYRFNNGVPNQITLLATPFTFKSDLNHDLGLFAQDLWTVGQMTFTGGVRFDYFKSSYPAQTLGPGPLVPNRNWAFPAEDNLNWKDITWRSGWAYDLRGDGKTALRASLNKYLAGQALGGFGSDTNPIRRLVNTTTRSWADANRDFIPQCDLVSAAANGECGPLANSAFGTQTPSEIRDLDLRTGWGHRGFNWEFSTGLQRELAPRVSMDVAYYRRWYGNFAATDDLNLTPTDFDAFSIVAPADPLLPGGGGKTITGLFDRAPAAFGRPVNNRTTLSKNYGKQVEHWNGFDLSLQARLRPGMMLQGGVSSGRTTTDNCEILAKLPEMAPLATSTPYCHVETPMRTQAKGIATYVVPRIDVQLAATFQSIPSATSLVANYNVPTAVVAQRLGRPLSGGAANATVNLVPPGTMFNERINQVDLRIGKILRFGPRRAMMGIDLYNLTNSDAVTAVNPNFATRFRPTSILQSRFAKISMQVDF